MKSQAAIREAAFWFARLTAETVSDADRAAWAAWRDAAPAHAQAWQRVEAVGAQLRRVPAQIAAPALLATMATRRTVLRSLAIAAAGGTAGWLGARALPWRIWTADYRTAVGERRDLRLADGSAVSINTASAVDVLYDAAQRRLELRAGEILVTTAGDPQARPFLVGTPQGTVRALGTRFTVRVDGESTRVAVLEKAVEIRPLDAPGRRLRLQAGEQLAFGRDAIEAPRAADASAASWQTGSLIAVDMPLGAWTAELSRYRRTPLACDPAIAALKVSGAFPIDDTDRALTALAHGFPVRIARRGDGDRIEPR